MKISQFFHQQAFSKFLKFSIFILVIINLVASLAMANPTEVKSEPSVHPKAGVLRFYQNNILQQQAITQRTDVEILISGLTARVKVIQFFKNDTDQWLEGKYLFPLPEKAAVDQLTIEMGDRKIIGEIKEKQQAKKIYQKAKLAGKKASLIEQQRPNLFTNSIANIGPYETIKVVIEYQQDIPYHRENGFSIRFPMTVTPRYQANKIYQESFDRLDNGIINQHSQQQWIVPNNSDNSEKKQNLVNISVILDSGMALESLTSSSHKIVQQQKSEREYLINFAKQSVLADRDFILNWKPIDSVKPRASVFSETRNGKHYASIMIVPPAISSTTQTSTNDYLETPVIPREIIFVIDTSGSMSGTSMKQAIEALKYGLTTLNTKDKFNVIQFNSNTEKLFYNAKIANNKNLQKARDYINSLIADGGTEMFDAMNQALSGVTDQNYLRQVIFLTDGAISNEAELFNLIDQKLADSRLYTVGIGSAPNAFFMKKAARFGRGTFTFIADVSESQTKIDALFKQISQPQLSHINIKWLDDQMIEMWPSRIPDLFDGEPLWIKVQLKNLSGKIAVSGRIDQVLWKSDLSLDNAQQQPGIATLWAREKIASIMNDSLHGKVSEQQKLQIIDTALEHHLVSRFTSLIAVEKKPSRSQQQLNPINIGNLKPKGYVPPVPPLSNLQFAATGLDLDLTVKNSLLLLVVSLLSLAFLRRFF